MSLHDYESLEFQVTAGRLPSSTKYTLETFDRLADDLVRQFERAFAGPGDWHRRFARAIDDTLAWLLERPGATRLWFLEARRTPDPELQARRAAARRQLVDVATDPRRDAELDVPELHVEFLFGALSHAAYDELAAGGDAEGAVRKVRELLALFEPLPA